MVKQEKKKSKEPAWKKDPRYRDGVEQATTFRLVLDGDRLTYLRLTNTFDWWRSELRGMDYIESAAESAFSAIRPPDIGKVVAKQAEKRREAAAKRIASGKSTPEKEAEKEAKALLSQPTEEEMGFQKKAFNAAVKVAEARRQGRDATAGLNVLYYEMRELFIDNNRKASTTGCFAVGSYIWDQARELLEAARDKKMVDFGNAKRSWMVARGVLGTLEFHKARIPILRCYKDHCSEFGDPRGKRTKNYDPNVKFVEEGKKQYVIVRLCKNPDVRLKFIVTGDVTNPDGTTWPKTPPASVRNMFTRFATGMWPAFTSYLGLDRKGRLSLLVTFVRPMKKGFKNRKGEMDVAFMPLRGDELPPPTGKKQADALAEWARTKDMQYIIHCIHTAETGRTYVERIAANAVIDRLVTLDKLKNAKVFQRDSQRYFPRKHQERLNASIRGYTEQRALFGVQVNHEWTKSLIHKANKWNVAKIRIFNMPKSTGLLLDESYPWQWKKFEDEIKSKAEYYGLQLEFVEEGNMEPIYNTLRSVFRERPGKNEKEKAGDGEETAEPVEVGAGDPATAV